MSVFPEGPLSAERAVDDLIKILEVSGPALINESPKAQTLLAELSSRQLPAPELEIILVSSLAATAEMVERLLSLASQKFEQGYEGGYFDGAVDAAARLSGQLAKVGVYVDLEEKEDGSVTAKISSEAPAPEEQGCGDPSCAFCGPAA